MTALFFWLILITALMLVMLLAPLWRTGSQNRKTRAKACLTIAVFTCVVCFGLYARLGSPGIVAALQQRDATLKEWRARIEALSQEVKRNPNQLTAWVGLGNGFMITGQYEAASHALKQAIVLSRGEPAFILAYAKALIAASGGKVTPEARQSLDMVLMLEPLNQEARSLLEEKQQQDFSPSELQ